MAIDQYSGKPLAVHSFLTDSQGYRWIRFNRSIHTGDIGGLAGHIVMSLSSLLLIVMAITGIVIWLKKLASSALPRNYHTLLGKSYPAPRHGGCVFAAG